MLQALLIMWILCVFPINAFWWHFQQNKHIRSPPTTAAGDHSARAALSNSTTMLAPNYKFSLPSVSVNVPTPTSQGMLVTSVVPIYEVCNVSGADSISCSTVLETVVTSLCSTVLTYAFKQVTVSDCNQSITFSTHNSYSLVTATVPAQKQATAPLPIASVTTYIQSITSYYYVPWQSLAVNTPTNITLRVCRSELSGVQNCSEIRQVWIVHTEFVPVTTTNCLSIATSFESAVVLLLGPTQSVSASGGAFDLSTAIEYQSMSPVAITSTSMLGRGPETTPGFLSSFHRTSTTTSTVIVTTTDPAVTVTRTVLLASQSSA